MFQQLGKQFGYVLDGWVRPFVGGFFQTRQDILLDSNGGSSTRHEVIALLHAWGVPNAVIAEQSGYSEPYVGILVRSPLLQEQIASYKQLFTNQIRDQLAAKTLDATALIEEAALGSVRALIEIRDDDMLRTSESGQNVRRQASNDLLDRHPKFVKRTHAETEHVVKISLGRADLQQMMSVHAALQPVVIDVEPEEQAPATAMTSPLGKLRSLADAIAACERPE